MNKKALNIIGLGLSIAGGAISIITGMIADKKTDITIAEKVAEEVAKQLEKK